MKKEWKDILREDLQMLYDFLVATKWGVFLLRTFLSFWKRGAIKNIETSEELLNLKEAGMHFTLKGNMGLPVVDFTISVNKQVYLKLQPQKIMLNLTCDSIPLKTFFWDRNYNIDDVIKADRNGYLDIEVADIKAIGGGQIIIRYPCVNVSYNHNYIHKWELKGKVTFNSKIREITKKITFSFRLGDESDRKKEDKLKEAINDFQKSYVDVGEQK
ncbi:MAG: hypothetical protein WBC40_09685 [Halobacteriota archaeon]